MGIHLFQWHLLKQIAIFEKQLCYKSCIILASMKVKPILWYGARSFSAIFTVTAERGAYMTQGQVTLVRVPVGRDSRGSHYCILYFWPKVIKIHLPCAHFSRVSFPFGVGWGDKSLPKYRSRCDLSVSSLRLVGIIFSSHFAFIIACSFVCFKVLYFCLDRKCHFGFHDDKVS